MHNFVFCVNRTSLVDMAVSCLQLFNYSLTLCSMQNHHINIANIFTLYFIWFLFCFIIILCLHCIRDIVSGDLHTRIISRSDHCTSLADDFLIKLNLPIINHQPYTTKTFLCCFSSASYCISLCVHTKTKCPRFSVLIRIRSALE